MWRMLKIWWLSRFSAKGEASQFTKNEQKNTDNVYPVSENNNILEMGHGAVVIMTLSFDKEFLGRVNEMAFEKNMPLDDYMLKIVQDAFFAENLALEKRKAKQEKWLH